MNLISARASPRTPFVKPNVLPQAPCWNFGVLLLRAAMVRNGQKKGRKERGSEGKGEKQKKEEEKRWRFPQFRFLATPLYQARVRVNKLQFEHLVEAGLGFTLPQLSLAIPDGQGGRKQLFTDFCHCTKWAPSEK